MIEQLYRAWRLFTVALWLLLGCFLALVLLRVDRHKGYSAFQLKFVRWWAAQLLAILGVRLSVHGVMQSSPVWVANHVSWLDIIVLMAVAPSRFF
jgi:1-acyl-sn-glycerol-3-phosphate acyltransferase